MMRTLFLLLLCGSATAATAQLKSATLKELDIPALTALTPVVRSIRAEPNTITIHVGQKLSLTGITVVVIDSAGKDRGRMSNFDFMIVPGAAASAVPKTVTGLRVGTAELAIHYPKIAWKSRVDPRPATTVTIDVKP